MEGCYEQTAKLERYVGGIVWRIIGSVTVWCGWGGRSTGRAQQPQKPCPNTPWFCRRFLQRQAQLLPWVLYHSSYAEIWARTNMNIKIWYDVIYDKIKKQLYWCGIGTFKHVIGIGTFKHDIGTFKHANLPPPPQPPKIEHLTFTASTISFQSALLKHADSYSMWEPEGWGLALTGRSWARSRYRKSSAAEGTALFWNACWDW